MFKANNNTKRSTLLQSSAAPQPTFLSQTKGPKYRDGGAMVMPKLIPSSSFGGMISSNKYDQPSPLQKTSSFGSSSLFSTGTTQEKVNIPKWEDSGEDILNLRNTFETNLSAMDVMDKVEKFLISEKCDVEIHPGKAEIHGRKWNEKKFDVTSFNIWLYQFDFQIRLKMVRNSGCSFTFQALLSNLFRHMANDATQIHSIYLKPSNGQTFGCLDTLRPLPIPMDLDLSLFGFEDLNSGWTEKEINDIIDDLENGYHESVHASCKQLAKESSCNTEFLEILCSISNIIDKFVKIVSTSRDVLVVRNMLTVLRNMWDYSRVQRNYFDFLESLETKWGDSQTIKLGPTQWTVDKSPEILRIIMESRRVLCSA